MNLDELQSVQSRERQASSLQHLRSSFYEEAAAYIGELRERRTQVAAESDNPFDDPDVERLSDEIRTAEGTVESIYERRVGKVVKLASIAAADMPYDDDGLTREEEQLFGTLVEAIEGNRERVLSVLDGESPALDCTPAAGDESTPAGGDGMGASGTTDADDARSGVGGRADTDRAGPGGVPEPTETPPETDTHTGSEPAAEADTERPPTSQGGPGPDTGRGRSENTPTPPDRPMADAEPAPGAAEASGSTEEEEPLDIGSVMGGASDGSPDRGDSGPAETGEDPPNRAEVAATAAGKDAGPAGTSEGGDDEPVERTTIRVTADVGNIFGIDGRSYDLSAEDVVTLPASNAENLVSKDAAVRLD
jgi:DNA replication factor GINS